MVDHARVRRIVAINQRDRVIVQAFEQPRLRCRVLLERAVIIEMVAGEVGEGGSGEMQPVGAFLIERVAGDFHDGGHRAGVDAFTQIRRQLKRAGRCHVGRHAAAAQVVVHRAEHSAAQAGLAQNGTGHERGGALAVGARDAEEFEIAQLRAVHAEPALREQRQGGAGVGDVDDDGVVSIG